MIFGLDEKLLWYHFAVSYFKISSTMIMLKTRISIHDPVLLCLIICVYEKMYIQGVLKGKFIKSYMHLNISISIPLSHLYSLHSM